MSVFAALLATLTLFYAGIMFRFARGLRRVLNRSGTSIRTPSPSVSVVVAARDEESNMSACLDGLLANTYPDFEVLVVDDHSTDNTAVIVRNAARNAPAERPIRLLSQSEIGEPGAKGKSAAVFTGVLHAHGEIILATDADCTVGPGWIEEMISGFAEETEMVAGPVLFETQDDWLSRLMALEFLGLVAVGAGGIGAGVPNMSNGANIAYRRDMYLARLRDVASDDIAPDETLLQILYRENPHSIAFCASPGAVVRTRPPGDVRSFVRQRIRWARTGARYPSKSLVASIAGIYLYYAMLAIVAVATFFNASLLPYLLLSLAAKIGVEASVIRPSARHFSSEHLIGLLVPGQLLQIPYVVVVGLAGAFWNVQWKGRSLVAR
ncbi:MAG: glycosyltransferase [Bacteroidota bacterium]